MRSPPPPLPARIGPVEFGELGRMVAVRCPKELAQHPAACRWRLGAWFASLAGGAAARRPAATDPLFHRAGLVLE
jgi:hypothetical protein